MKHIVCLSTLAFALSAVTANAKPVKLECTEASTSDIEISPSKDLLKNSNYSDQTREMNFFYDTDGDKNKVGYQTPEGDDKANAFTGKTVHFEKNMFTSVFDFENGFSILSVYLTKERPYVVVSSQNRETDGSQNPRIQTTVYKCLITKNYKGEEFK